MRTLELLILALLSILFCSCEKSIFGIRGKGDTVSNSPVFEQSITGIDLSVDAHVHFIKSETQKVQIDAQQNIFDNMDFSVNNGVLAIDFDKNVRKHDPIDIYIYTDECHRAHISGSGTITADSTFQTDEPLSIHISGSGNTQLSVIAPEATIHISVSGTVTLYTQTNSIETDISGSGTLNLSGTADNANFEISGSGDVNGFGLTTQDCHIRVSGASDIKITAQQSLDVKVSGSGDVAYKGNPSVTTDISGSGDVTHKE